MPIETGRISALIEQVKTGTSPEMRQELSIYLTAHAEEILRMSRELDQIRILEDLNLRLKGIKRIVLAAQQAGISVALDAPFAGFEPITCEALQESIFKRA